MGTSGLDRGQELSNNPRHGGTRAGAGTRKRVLREAEARPFPAKWYYFSNDGTRDGNGMRSRAGGDGPGGPRRRGSRSMGSGGTRLALAGGRPLVGNRRGR